MKAVVCVIAVVLVSLPALAAETAPKVVLDARDKPIADVVKEISAQTGAAIVLDPTATGSVTASLTNAELSQALDVITKANNLSWKKAQFARPTDSKVQLEQLKMAVLALAQVPLVGLSVEDPASKTSTVFAKDLPAAPDTSAIRLPEGYAWQTVYVILAPDEKTEKTTATAGATDVGQNLVNATLEMAKLTPEERQQIYVNDWVAQLTLPQDLRRSLLRDRMQALFSLDPESRDQLREDMHSIFHDLRGRRGDGERWQRDPNSPRRERRERLPAQ